MILKINSTRGHTGSLLVNTIGHDSKQCMMKLAMTNNVINQSYY